MWNQAMSGWEREMMGDADAAGVPDWLTNPIDRARWLTLGPADRSDWARAHGGAVASTAMGRQVEADAEAGQKVQALEEAYASLRASIPASAPSPIPDRRWMLWAGGALVVGYLVLHRGKRRKARRK